MAKERTGTVAFRRGRWFARVRYRENGTRPWLPLKATNEDEARVEAVKLQDAADRGMAHTAPNRTVQELFNQWVALREQYELVSVRDDRNRWKVHLRADLAHRKVGGVDTTTIQRIVDRLDAKVREEKMSWYTARRIYQLLRSLFGDRKRTGLAWNPVADVKPPRRGLKKDAQFLYPAEVSALLECADVPRERRQFWALATYLGARVGELETLRVGDVNLAQRTVRIHRSVDRYRGREKATKTGQSREFAYELTLHPLMVALCKGRDPAARVVQLPAIATNLARFLRRDLRTAGVDRAALYRGDWTSKELRAHDLRATCTTWMVVRGDDPLRIRHRMGHASLQTTDVYARRKAMVNPEAFGAVFAPLPEALYIGPALDPRGSELSAPGRNRTCDLRFRKPHKGALPVSDSEKHATSKGASRFAALSTGGGTAQVQGTGQEPYSTPIHPTEPTKPDISGALAAQVSAAVDRGDIVTAQTLLAALQAVTKGGAK